MDWIETATPRQLARIAGGLYLLVVIGGGFAIGYVDGVIIVPGDAAATVHNISSHEQLYRFGLVAHMAILPLNILLAVIFYELFTVVSRRLALLVVFFTLVATADEAANLLNQFAPLNLLNGSPYTSALSAAQLQALAYLPVDMTATSYEIQQVIFAGYLLAAGFLVFRSTFLPRTVGVLLAIAGLSYLFYSFAAFISPGFANHLVPYIQIPSGVGEISFCLWLLIAGVNPRRWNERAIAARERDRILRGDRVSMPVKTSGLHLG